GGGRDRTARRTARVLSAVRGDRGLATHGGSGGMSAPRPPAAPPNGAPPNGARGPVPGRLPPAGRPGAGGGPPWMRKGMPGEKSLNFVPSAKRLIGRLRPHRLQLMLIIALGVASVVLSVTVPKVLCRATDVIFAGVIGKRFPPGVSREQAVAAARASGHVNLADLLARVDFTPGVGIDFDRL